MVLRWRCWIVAWPWVGQPLVFHSCRGNKLNLLPWWYEFDTHPFSVPNNCSRYVRMLCCTVCLVGFLFCRWKFLSPLLLLGILFLFWKSCSMFLCILDVWWGVNIQVDLLFCCRVLRWQNRIGTAVGILVRQLVVEWMVQFWCPVAPSCGAYTPVSVFLFVIVVACLPPVVGCSCHCHCRPAISSVLFNSY